MLAPAVSFVPMMLAPALADLGPISPFGWVALSVLCVALGALLLCELLGTRYIPNNRVGIAEKLWSPRGSVSEGRILALNGEAGFQADVLRGGIHFGLWRWQYRIHKLLLVTVPQGKIGYVYARDGEPLLPSQTLGRVVSCNNFQDARAFLGEGVGEDEMQRGQRGRQRAILREGVYALNPAHLSRQLPCYLPSGPGYLQGVWGEVRGAQVAGGGSRVPLPLAEADGLA
jgi:uncharacterized membrane protein YqiK